MLTRTSFHRTALLIILAVLATALVALPACSSGGSSTASGSADGASASASSVSTSAVSSASSNANSSSREAVVTDEQRAEMIEQRQAWTDGIVKDSVAKLVEDGIIETNDGETQFYKMFQFESDGNGGYDIAYKDTKAKASLTGDFTLPAGKVAICRTDYGSEERPVEPLYNDGKHIEGSRTMGLPLFYPESFIGEVGEDGLAVMLDGIDNEAFAGSFDECDYLILYDRFASHIDEGYYMGNIDRESATTMVFVIDAKEHKVVHIENIGTDTPGKSVKMGQNRGDMKYDEMEAYINALLKR